MKEIIDEFKDEIKHVNEADKYLKISDYLKLNEPIFFEDVNGYKAAGNLWSSKKRIADYLNIKRNKIPKFILEAQNQSKEKLNIVNNKTHQSTEQFSLKELPIPTYFKGDGGPYLTPGIVVAKDPESGVRNASYHRMMVRGEKSATIRLVPRHLYSMSQKVDNLDVLIALGSPLSFLLSSAISFEFDKDELKLANQIERMSRQQDLDFIKINDMIVPKKTEIIFEATITNEYDTEGPFVDITGTRDEVRQQPIVEFKKMHFKPDPIFYVLLPGGHEHFNLMGIPKEATIYESVKNTVPKVHGVNLTPGGCSWLHGVISISKQSEGDAKNALIGALSGHTSMKHVVAVDQDINIYDKEEVEWAIATRFQADKDLIKINNARGSSLDPSKNEVTSKLGFDATKPLDSDEKYDRLI